MSLSVQKTHPHIQFKKIWEISKQASFLLGQCQAYVEAITATPILPKDHQDLLQLSFIKGALATTAIEGNTLTEAEALKVLKGKKLAPSREYQEKEVTNVITALNELVNEIVEDDRDLLVTPELIKEFHRRIGKELGEHFDAVPGWFRTDNRVVGGYKAPDYKFVEVLMRDLCAWLYKEFHYVDGQEFADVVIQAIVSHVFLEWIHPFGDGNGRTGRLLEFYLLLRGGLPNIASHILSNHYNDTRPEYYRQLNNSRLNRSLTGFIEYALLGFRDGLAHTLETVQSSQHRIAWDRYVYAVFGRTKMGKSSVFKRRRSLALAIPLHDVIAADDVSELNTEIARLYSGLSRRTILRDLEELDTMGLIVRSNGNLMTNDRILGATGHFPKHRIR